IIAPARATRVTAAAIETPSAADLSVPPTAEWPRPDSYNSSLRKPPGPHRVLRCLFRRDELYESSSSPQFVSRGFSHLAPAAERTSDASRPLVHAPHYSARPAVSRENHSRIQDARYLAFPRP